MDKKHVLRFLLHATILSSILVLLAAGYMGLAYLRDPLCLFHPSESGRHYVDKEMRIQAAGFINSFDFDSAIVGTSMMQNSSSAVSAKALGGRFMNLCMRGANFAERSILLDYLFKKKEVKSIVYSLDRYFLTCDTGGYAKRFWTFLYDDNKWNDLKVYADSRYMRGVLFRLPEVKAASLDRPGAWDGNPSYRCLFGGLQSWVANLDKSGMEEFFTQMLPETAERAVPSCSLPEIKKREAALEAYVEKYLLSFAAKNPKTNFYLVFPPYWRFEYARMRQTAPASFALHQSCARYLVRRAAELGNVRVFGFEDCSFVEDVANYRDTTHHSTEINNYITESMGKGEHLLTPDNVEAYLARCEELARTFDIKGLNEKAQKMLAGKK